MNGIVAKVFYTFATVSFFVLVQKLEDLCNGTSEFRSTSTDTIPI